MVCRWRNTAMKSAMLESGIAMRNIGLQSDVELMQKEEAKVKAQQVLADGWQTEAYDELVPTRLPITRVTAAGGNPERWLLVLHGIYGSGRNWGSIARRLVDARPEWGVLLVDLRLHGGSTSGFEGPHTLAATAAIGALGLFALLRVAEFEGGRFVGLSRFLLTIAPLLALVVANGVFAMSEIALVSSRKPRLQQLAGEGHAGARLALSLANDPTRFLLIEIYRTPADPARHKETAHYAAWRDAVELMMAEPRRSVKYHALFPEPALWELDHSHEGFRWLEPSAANENVLAFVPALLLTATTR